MAVIVKTSEPSVLLKAIKTGIAEGDIETWSCDRDGAFSHETDSGQWKGKARLKQTVEADRIVFKLSWLNGSEHEPAVRGVYEGRFVEMLVTHFRDRFSSIEVTGTQKP